MLIFVHMSVYVRTIYAPTRYTSNRRPPRNSATFVALSYFRFYNSPGRILWHASAYCIRDVLRMQRSALHSLTHVMRMKKSQSVSRCEATWSVPSRTTRVNVCSN